MLPRLVLAIVIMLAGSALAADYLSADRGSLVQTRHGDGFANATPSAYPAAPLPQPTPAAKAAEKPTFCGFAPCGMPLDCPSP